MKKNHIISWIVQIIVAAILCYPAWGKLTSSTVEVELFTVLGMEPHGRYIIGLLESLAIILLMIPRSAVWGAFLALCIMSGAFLAHATKIGFLGELTIVSSMLWVVILGSVAILALRNQEIPFLRDAFARSTTPHEDDGTGNK
jgi:uncharacterized membrane protein YphA (DoxX/SURF4 family)